MSFGVEKDHEYLAQNTIHVVELCCRRQKCVLVLVYIYMLVGVRMSSILRIILTSWVASWIWDFLLCRVSITLCSFMSQVPISMQFTPRAGLFSVTCLLLISVRVRIGSRPQFSARARGTDSKASAKARKAYCSMVLILSASFDTAIAQEISAAPPPYTTRLSRTRLRTTQRASCIDRLASSMIILVPPRRKMVTAFELAHSSITSILSLVVPKLISLTLPAVPSLSELSSWNLGTILPPVAMAISSISGPPTHRTAGRSRWRRRWFASSSKPHWQIARLAPAAFTSSTIFSNVSFSY